VAVRPVIVSPDMAALTNMEAWQIWPSAPVPRTHIGGQMRSVSQIPPALPAPVHQAVGEYNSFSNPFFLLVGLTLTATPTWHNP
jgi:hypothetical protein